MSEYQYFEFRAIDRPLSQGDMAALRSITSRAAITPTSLVNVYHFGDFKGSPVRLMEQYFDAFLYVANWGTHRLMLRFPRRLFDPDDAAPYEVDHAVTVRATPEHVILDFHINEEPGDWEEGEGWLDALIPLRNDLLAGDLRSLYLAWLAGVQLGEVDEEAEEPPVPPGLGQLSAPLKRFADFLWLDPPLLEVAAEASPEAVPAEPAPEELAAWVARLPTKDKDDYLVRLIQGEAHLAGQLLKLSRQAQVRPGRRAGGRPVRESRRTAGQLLRSGEAREEENRRRAAEQAARERERAARARAEERARYLDALSGREEEWWRKAEAAIASKQPKQYDQAVSLLRDLCDLGERAGTPDAFAARLRELRERHRAKYTLIQRLDKAGLPE